jgi:hypothetical protein
MATVSVGVNWGAQQAGAPTTERHYITDDVNSVISDLKFQMRAKINLVVD